MPQPTTVRDFIDIGDNCSESGPPSSIGSYDNGDSFIDDEEVRSESNLFVSQYPVRQSIERQDVSVHSALSRVARQHGLRVVHSPTSSSVGSRGENARASHQAAASSCYSSSSNGSRQGSVPTSEQSSGSVRRIRRSLVDGRSYSRLRDSRSASPRSRGRERVRRPGGRRSLSGSRTSVTRLANRVPTREASKTPDPQLIPDHLRKDELKGISVPSLRLGSNRSRWASRFFLLTYSQSGNAWPHGALVELCETLGAKHHISRERHEDGGYHFHAFLDFQRKFETENVHRFCVGSARPGSARSCPGQTHCNILPVPRTPYNAWDYVGKYGDIVSSNLDRPLVRGPNTTRDDLWTGSLALADKNQFLADIKKHSPRDYCLFGGAIKATASDIFGEDKAQPDLPLTEPRGLVIHWDRYPSIREWVLGSLPNGVEKIIRTSGGTSYSQEMQDADRLKVLNAPHLYPKAHRPQSLILYGGTRLGKSDFATSLGPHIQWRGQFNLESLREVGIDAVEYVIWDDIGWKDSALVGEKYKCWLGSQDNFNATDKFKHKLRLKPWNKPSIYLANKNPFLGLEPEDSDWLEANCVIVDIGHYTDERLNAICSETVNR